MARETGKFVVADTYEVTSSGPFDARGLVDTVADLISPASWPNKNGIYTGMLVVVAKDVKSKNGVYMLVNKARYDSIFGWQKLADTTNIEELNADKGKSVNVKTYSDLPETGDLKYTYFVEDENATYRWNYLSVAQPELPKYVCCGRDYKEIKIINGGNAETK